MRPHTVVTSTIHLTVQRQARLAFAVAVPDGTPTIEESFTLTIDGEPVDTELAVDNLGTRFHLVDAHPGAVHMEYQADVEGTVPPLEASPVDQLLYSRPSRYCESDRFGPLAASNFPGLEGQELVDAIAKWVHGHLRYIPGASGSEDSAIDTLLAGQGVCRDYAHLTVAMLRGAGIPARVAAVYAPALIPMDFHLVAEALLDGRWQVIDTTRKAPRASLIRVATGRDAADTAFLSVLSGRVRFGPVRVTAYHHGDLAIDDHTSVVHL